MEENLSFVEKVKDKSLAWLKEKGWWLLVAFLLGGGLTLAYQQFFQASAPDQTPLFAEELTESIAKESDTEPLSDASFEKQTEKAQEEEEWSVDVKGAVKKPGVYPVTAGERVIDVVDRAGGLSEEADETALNLALKVTDQMVIYVPRPGEEQPAESPVLAPQASENVHGSGAVNLNTATVEELQTLSGIGEKKAADIISYREAHGPFKQVDDLLQISGIGEKTLDKFREQVTVS